MKLLYGTTNKAKLELMQRALSPIGIEVIGLKDVGREIPEVLETGDTPLENAMIKAKAYYDAFKIPVFSCDSGLYFDGISEDEQPGIYVRRVNGKELSDEEMTEYYASLSAKHGGNLIGRYMNAIYLILDEERHYKRMDFSIATEPFILASTPHEKKVSGFPLDRLSKDIKSGMYYYDMDSPTLTTDTEAGLRKFFEESLGI
jgi:8-oxo-dGTP diphosphatase